MDRTQLSTLDPKASYQYQIAQVLEQLIKFQT